MKENINPIAKGFSTPNERTERNNQNVISIYGHLEESALSFNRKK